MKEAKLIELFEYKDLQNFTNFYIIYNIEKEWVYI